jgi:hypothetical protein
MFMACSAQTEPSAKRSQACQLTVAWVVLGRVTNVTAGNSGQRNAEGDRGVEKTMAAAVLLSAAAATLMKALRSVRLLKLVMT